MNNPYYHDEKYGITIYHGDCRDILPELEPVDLVLTDIPYDEVNRKSQGLRKLEKGTADKKTAKISEILKVLDLGESVYCFCGIKQVSALTAGLQKLKFSTRLGFWEKENPSPLNGEYLWLSASECCVFGRKEKAFFYAFFSKPIWKGPRSNNLYHETEKPIWLFKRLIMASSVIDDTILDPFMGSGTTLVAAKELGRKAIGIEIEEKYCEIAVKRLQQDVFQWSTDGIRS